MGNGRKASCTPFKAIPMEASPNPIISRWMQRVIYTARPAQAESSFNRKMDLTRLAWCSKFWVPVRRRAEAVHRKMMLQDAQNTRVIPSMARDLGPYPHHE